MHIYICICIYVNMYVYVHAYLLCMYVHICMYMCLYTHTYQHKTECLEVSGRIFSKLFIVALFWWWDSGDFDFLLFAYVFFIFSITSICYCYNKKAHSLLEKKAIASSHRAEFPSCCDFSILSFIHPLCLLLKRL